MSEAQTLAASTLSGRYTELPKTLELIELGVTPELIPTFHALTDYVSNQTGRCYPQMKTIAAKLRISVRTVQRHLHSLADLGLIDFVKRLRTDEGKYRGYVYRIAHIEKIAERRKAKKREQQERERQRALERGRKRRKRLFNQKPSTGHGSPVRANRGTSTEQENPPNPPTESFKEGYEWLFGDQPDPEREKQHHLERQRKREEESKRMREGYEWFFD